MRSQFLQLMLHVFFDVLESVEKGRRDGGGASAVLDARAQLLLGGVHQAAVGVVDDHEFLGFQQVVGDKQRAQGVVGDDASRVANDVRVPGLQSHRANGEARVHTGQNRELARRARSQRAQLMRARVKDRKSTRLNSSHTVIAYAVF